MNTLFTLIAIQIALGTLDNLWHHEITERLPAKRAARRELSLHATRELLYALLFVGIAHWTWEGAFSLVIAGLLAIEVCVTAADFVVEDMTRRLPKLERILHTVLAVNYGAILAAFAPVLIDWWQMPTAVVAADYGWWSLGLTAAGCGVGCWAVRDAMAAARHLRPREWQRVRLVPGTTPDPKRILVTGATGFIGTALTRRLIARGEHVIVLTRDRERALDRFGPHVEIVVDLDALPSAASLDAIVNLAGAPIAGARWTERRKLELIASRHTVTDGLLRLVTRLDSKPQTWINASAVGYYGVRNDDTPLDEKSPTQERFQADLCASWEQLAGAAGADGVKVAALRFGLVLGADGGALPSLARSVRYRLGAVLGSGRQWFSWIHIDDAVGLIEFVLDERVLAGPINATAPEPVRHEQLMRMLARVLDRKLLPLRIPAGLIRIALGELAELVVDGQCVVPARARALGYRFRHPNLSGALVDCLGRPVGRPSRPMAGEVNTDHGCF
jgi:uncharacterized protein